MMGLVRRVGKVIRRTHDRDRGKITAAKSRRTWPGAATP